MFFISYSKSRESKTFDNELHEISSGVVIGNDPYLVKVIEKFKLYWLIPISQYPVIYVLVDGSEKFEIKPNKYNELIKSGCTTVRDMIKSLKEDRTMQVSSISINSNLVNPLASGTKSKSKVPYIILAVLAVIFLCCGGLFVVGYFVSNDTKGLEPKKEQITSRYKELGQVATNMESYDYDNVSECTTEVGSKILNVGEYVSSIPYVNWSYLKTFKTGDAGDMEKDWEFMNSSDFSKLDKLNSITFNIAADNVTSTLDRINKKSFIFVFEDMEKDLPEVRNPGPGYYIGTYDGYLTLIDLKDTSKPVCSEGFVFENSQSTTFSSDATDSEKLKVLKEDLNTNFKTALDNAFIK